MRRWLSILAVWAWTVVARAHAGGVSMLEARLGADGQGEVVWSVPAPELAPALEPVFRLDSSGDGAVDSTEVGAQAPLLARWLAAATRLQTDAGDCRWLSDAASATVEAGGVVVLSVGIECPGSVETSRLGWRAGHPLGAGHSTLVRLETPATRLEQLLSDATPALGGDDASDRSTEGTALWRRFLVSGLEHIATGFDHLLFLLLLVLTSRRLRDVVWRASAFTLAHGITLSLVVLEQVPAPGAWVEPAIAVSIAWVAARAWWRSKRADSMDDSTDRSTVALVFVFGLLHGLGFAGALGALDLPLSARVQALAAFHVGIEAGQVAGMALAWALLGAVRSRKVWKRGGYPALLLAVFGVAVYWFAERVRQL
jgi:hypothetical protein